MSSASDKDTAAVEADFREGGRSTSQQQMGALSLSPGAELTTKKAGASAGP